MKIKVENYFIVSREYGYDLAEQKVAKKKDSEEEYLREETLGYNMSMNRCIEKIIHLNLHNKKVVVDLKRFLALYRAENDRINKIVEKVLK